MDYNQIIEELKIHQIELEMQNDELKQTQYRLQSEKDKYYSLVNLLPIGFIKFDNSYKITFFNNKFSELYDYNKDNLLNKDISAFVAPDNQDEFFMLIRKAIEKSPISISQEIVLLSKNKNKIHTRFNIRYQKNEKMFHATIEDISISKKNETELLKSNERLKHSYMLAKVGSWEYDVKNNEFFLADETKHLINLNSDNNIYTFEEAIKLADEKYREDLFNYFKELIEGNNDKKHLQFRISKNLAYEKYFSITGSSINDKNGNPEKIIGVLKDITNRVTSEELRLKYLAILDNMNDAIIVVDNEGKIYGWNKAASQIYKYSEDEVIGKNITDICKSPNEEENCKVLINKIDNNQEVKDFPVQRYDKFGNIKEILVSITKIILNNEMIGYSILMRDITDQMKNHLLYSKWQKAIEQSPNLVVITDKDGNIEYVNNKFFEVTGYSKSEIINKNPKILKSGYHKRKFYEELWNTIKSGKVWRGEFLNKKKNGDTYWENAIISPVFDNNNNIINYIALKEDITPLKTQQSELEKAKNIAEKANSIKSVILGNISHELRTPLNGIIGGIQIMQSFEDDNYKEVIGIIDESTKRLKNALELLLDLSKVQTEDTSIVLKRTNISNLLNQLTYHYEKLCNKKNLQFKSEIKYKELYAKIDNHLFGKMMEQILQNAVKFSDKGKIIIGITKKDDNRIHIYVSDEGVGIPKDKFDIIKQEFRQVSEGINRKYEGLGLGLTFVVKIVDLFGGKLDIKSKKDEGTTVNIIFDNSEF